MKTIHKNIISLFSIVSLIILVFQFYCSNNLSNTNTLSDKTVIFGAAISPENLDETRYSETLIKYFNCVVPENHLKWELIQPNSGVFDFTGSDKIVDFAENNSMKIRGHVLLWHYQLPEWIKNKNNSELEIELNKHIKSVAGRYKGKIFAWDVANEVVMSADSGLRNRTKDPSDPDYSIWSQNSSDDSLIKKAFVFASEADPDAKLFINDNNSYGSIPEYEEWNQLQADLLYEYVNKWKKEGVPVHGVGLQLHLSEDQPPNFSMIENDIIRYEKIGMIVHFTEIDVRVKEPITDEKLKHQLEIYKELARIAKKHQKTVEAFVTWGVTDKYSWIPLYFNGYGSGLLFDETYGPKQSYFDIMEILNNKN